LEKLEANLMVKKDKLLQYFKFVAPTMKELGQKMSKVDVSQSAVGVILLLMSYFGDCEATLFHGYEVSVCHFIHQFLVQLYHGSVSYYQLS
jgi:hypothetical protein